MRIDQQRWTKKDGWQMVRDEQVAKKAALILAFGSTDIVKQPTTFKDLKTRYPKANIVTCSTAGEILGTTVSDDTMTTTAIEFKHSNINCVQASISKTSDSRQVGVDLAKQLPTKDLIHAMAFSDGMIVNGTALVQGFRETLPKNISVTGGLVGDGTRFKETVVGLDAVPSSGNVVLIGFYGSKIKIGYGSFGGWDPFGPVRTITKSKYNVLFELDGKPALSLYKDYLGDQAKDLPASGLLFPLSLRIKAEDGVEEEIVRTILAVDEKDQSMTFAGDMPEGIQAQLMKANFDRLIDGATSAAEMSGESIQGSKPELAILVSCVGRKLVLKERIEEEVEAVANTLGENVALTGFYSYGEICPTAAKEKQCQLHNQTMTITTLQEID